MKEKYRLLGEQVTRAFYLVFSTYLCFLLAHGSCLVSTISDSTY